MSIPAQMLVGEVLEDGWKVVKRLRRSGTQTGAGFSEGYIVESPTGQKAFLKALDLSKTMLMADPVFELNAMTAAFLYERNLLWKCKERRLDRVVTALAHGQWRPPPEKAWGLVIVPYLIFELADGDVRAPALSGAIDLAWKLRSLHHIAVALEQLHRLRIAHEDLKPSNVLVFQGKSSKVGDLGCAADQSTPKPEGSRELGGDPQYATPEVLYRCAGTEWAERCARDSYHLGSMLIYFFTGAGTTELVVKKLGDSHHPKLWRGQYQEGLLLWRDAFGRVLDDFEAMVPTGLRAELRSIAYELCEPDPALRGLPSNRRKGRSPYDLHWYISRFDVLAKKVELKMIRGEST